MKSDSSRPIRIIDIAHRARVSYTAAAQVLRGTAGPRAKVSQTTAARIRRVAAELGYSGGNGRLETLEKKDKC